MSEHNPTFYETVVSSPQWKAWYEEVMRRFIENSKLNYQKNKTFDIDESQECGWLGEKHFQEFLNFVVYQYKQQILKDLSLEIRNALSKRIYTVEKTIEDGEIRYLHHCGDDFNGLVKFTQDQVLALLDKLGGK